jgi:hypothetical protein
MASVIINLIFGLLFTYVPAVSQFLSGSSYWIIWGFNLLVEFLLFGITGIGIILVLKAPYSDPREPDAERRSTMELLVKWVLYTLVFLTIFAVFQAAGWFSSITTGIFSNPPWDALLVGLIYGLILGSMQFLFFRQQVDHAYLWIIASIVGGGLLYISQSAGAHTDLFRQPEPASFLPDSGLSGPGMVGAGSVPGGHFKSMAIFQSLGLGSDHFCQLWVGLPGTVLHQPAPRPGVSACTDRLWPAVHSKG